MLRSLALSFAAFRLAWRVGPRRTRTLRDARKYLLDRERFLSLGGQVAVEHPVLSEHADAAGSARGHYFHQDLLVATRIHERRPRRHIDVGSRIDGFVAHVAAFREIEVFDIRPLEPTVHGRIRFVQGDLMSAEGVPAACCDSLSCLHALEHFGLGRYGDPVDPQGHRKGFANLHRMLEPGGLLYLSFPIGTSGTHFNAHRVFAPAEVLEWSPGLFELESFAYVDDAGDLHLDRDPRSMPPLRYGCGIYTLRRL